MITEKNHKLLTSRAVVRLVNLFNYLSGHMIGWLMRFNATFNNISVISWQAVLLVEETRIPRENHRPAASH
jgi:hypothetical protein